MPRGAAYAQVAPRRLRLDIGLAPHLGGNTPRLEPVAAGATVKQGDKVERLKEVRMFEECSQRQLRSIASIARVCEAPAGTMLTRADVVLPRMRQVSSARSLVSPACSSYQRQRGV